MDEIRAKGRFTVYIYKITCLINNKIYIGQTKQTIEQRFEQHKNAALKNTLDTHFCRALRKYGVDNFSIEQIDSATTAEELTEKEYYWINYYNSFDPEIGYNETNNKNRCGGDTYKNKSLEEMLKIKSKISKANAGANNGMSRAVKIKNIETNEILHFGSAFECARYFNKKGTIFIRKRCNDYKYLYEDKWLIAYEEDEFKEPEVFDSSTRKGVSVTVIDLATGESQTFSSKNKASKILNIDKQVIQNNIIIDHYKILIS